MARQKALSLLQGVGEKADLAEVSGIIIEGVKAECVSTAFKSNSYTGNPAAGSCEFKRFANSEVKELGTARTAGKGDEIKAPPVTVNLDTHKEIVEEVKKFDIDTFGVPNLIARRGENHIDSMASHLDKAYFTKLHAVATVVASTKKSHIARLSDAIVKLANVKNDYVDGVPYNIMRVATSVDFYESIRTFLDTQGNPNVDTAAEEFGMYHGVRVYKTVHMPAGVDAIITVAGSAAQPVISYPFSEPEKIPLDEAYATELFFHYGTKELSPDLIFELQTVSDTLEELTVTSAAGETATGDSVITVDPETPATGNSYVYKLGLRHIQSLIITLICHLGQHLNRVTKSLVARLQRLQLRKSQQMAKLVLVVPLPSSRKPDRSVILW